MTMAFWGNFLKRVVHYENANLWKRWRYVHSYEFRHLVFLYKVKSPTSGLTCKIQCFSLFVDPCEEVCFDNIVVCTQSISKIQRINFLVLVQLLSCECTHGRHLLAGLTPGWETMLNQLRPASHFFQVFVSSLSTPVCVFIRQRIYKHMGELWQMTRFAHQTDFYQGH